MIAMIRAGFAVWTAKGLILDFRGLQYDYGDMMDGVIDYTHDSWIGQDCPTVVVTSHRNRNGLTGLVLNVMGDSPEKWLFDNMEDAVVEIDKRHARSVTKFMPKT